MGGGRTPSPFVGLVLIKPRPAPDLPSPPINSLPPLLCPPGLEGIALVAPGEVGDCGGLEVPEPSCADAARLKLKLGKGGGGDRPGPLGRLRIEPESSPCKSNVCLCPRPVAFDKDDGAEDGA